MKVLIADDHEIVREGLTRLIDRQSGMGVVGYAENGLDALIKAKFFEPDIVIMDSGMPVLSGIEAVPLIRNAVPHTKIIIFSINMNDEYIHTSFQSGASGYVLKLSPCQDIVDSIRAAQRGERFVSPLIKKNIVEQYTDTKDYGLKQCRYDLLTNMEQRVFRLIVEGYSTNEIAKKISLSPSKTRQIKMAISDKIQLHDKEAMIHYAEEIGIITPKNWNDLFFDPMPRDII